MNLSKDLTIQKNYLNRFESLVLDYELIKSNSHPRYKLVKDFFLDNKISHQNFSKYYHRFLLLNRSPSALFPLKRGPKYKLSSIDPNLEQYIISKRNLGFNKFDILSSIKRNTSFKPCSLSTIYNYCVKHNLNILNIPMKQQRVHIIKQRPGELVHVDCHDLGRNIINNDPNKYFLLSIIDDFSRIAYAEVITDLKSLTVMFATLRAFNIIRLEHGIQTESVISDNGPEFGKKTSKNKLDHPFERMLIELDIKHIYTRPYRPQTNGKIERFWKTLHYDLIDETDFKTLDELKDELSKYLYYYNNLRAHQGIAGSTPANRLISFKNASN